MPKRTWFAVLAGFALLAAAGCGDDSTQVGALPTLVGTAIPTAVIIPSPTPTCDAAAVGELPVNFPADFPLPPNSVAESIETTPYLRIVFRVTPPPGASGQKPYVILAGAMDDQMQQQGWTLAANREADGLDWTFTKDDGRSGRFNILPYKDCPAAVRLTLDLLWITG